MTVKLWTKPETQFFIKRLRENGYIVDKVDGGYVCHCKTENGIDLVFKAMQGMRGYLVRINDNYIQQQ
jgi:predicted transcriptional regulator